ncbi:hypothetical protein ABZ682_26700 [Streptomyces griseoviridis]|uniref:hypothetical protein n=1 Tax=Streptomyces TaxID=1883 RepID=UPI002476C9C3|nr:hypothetical protein [Streptomyces sp. MAA16]MDH6697022.1 hypothetical protein [Streptomyces sp. MAA16]
MPTKSLPSAAGCTLQDAGDAWDAIRTPRSVGLAAMEILGARCGAVAEGASGTALYFFVPVGTARDWSVGNTRALGPGATVTIPPTRRTDGPGPHWRICPGGKTWLTDPDALRAALGECMRVAPVPERTA